MIELNACNPNAASLLWMRFLNMSSQNYKHSEVCYRFSRTSTAAQLSPLPSLDGYARCRITRRPAAPLAGTVASGARIFGDDVA